MIKDTGVRTGIRDISIRLISEFPVIFAAGNSICDKGLPIRYIKVEEKEAKLEISVEKLKNFLKGCSKVEEIVDYVLKEVEYNLPEGVLTIAKVYADGVKIRELSFIEEHTSLGRGIVIDETREPEENIPIHAKENREKILKTIKEILTLELIYSL